MFDVDHIDIMLHQDPGVLAAMGEVPREEFVPEHLRRRAYDDSPLPIGWDQTISQPYMVAVMTERLRLDGREIPVLVTTTHAGDNAERLVQKLGAEGYISKPLSSSEVLSRITEVVGDGQSAVAKT